MSKILKYNSRHWEHSLHNASHLTDDEEDDGHCSAGQCDKHQELEPENETLQGDEGDALAIWQLFKQTYTLLWKRLPHSAGVWPWTWQAGTSFYHWCCERLEKPWSRGRGSRDRHRSLLQWWMPSEATVVKELPDTLLTPLPKKIYNNLDSMSGESFYSRQTCLNKNLWEINIG